MLPTTPGMTRRLTAILLVAAASVLGTAGSASAATTCDPGALTKPFAPWLDYFNYAQVPGGRFETGLTGWTLKGGAKVVSGNEPWRVAGTADSRSLLLPAGASVTTPKFCGGLGYPTVRLFSKGGKLLTNLRVEVLYTDASGLLRSSSLGLVLPSATWQPTLPMVTLSGLPLLTGSSMALRLTAVGASYTVDDLFVDPYSRN